MELDRKWIIAIIVALMVIVPVAALSYYAWGPAQLDSINIVQLLAANDRDGVVIIGDTEGSGAAFSGKVDLVISKDNEQVYSGKISYIEGALNEKILLSDFAIGNGQYEFEISHEGLSDAYYIDLDMCIEELGVLSANVTGVQNDEDLPSGTQLWHALYKYNVQFKTGWHYFEMELPSNTADTVGQGYKVVGDHIPLKVETGQEHDVTIEVRYENWTQADILLKTVVAPAGELYDEDVVVPENGTYRFIVRNEATVTNTFRLWDNKVVECPEDMRVEFTLNLDGSEQDEFRLASKVENVRGYWRPSLGPGYYNITISLDNPTVKKGTEFDTLTHEDEYLLNDLPKALTTAGEPYVLDRLGTRTVTYDATASFDDGPKADLIVFWSFGYTEDGKEIGSVRGPWETYKTYSYTYAIGELPDTTNGRPFLILRDAYGAETEPVYVNLAIS